MKKTSSMISLLLGLLVSCMTLVSCSDDNDELAPGHDAEKNTTDVAVTGAVSDIGVFYAQISGVVNLGLITASYTNVKIGVEVSTTPDFTNKKRTEASGVVGRTFSVRVGRLSPETKYYYRTFVSVSTLSYEYYGKTYTFTTKPINKDAAVTGSVSDIGAFSAKISGTTNPKDAFAAGAEASAGVEIAEDADFLVSNRRIKANDEIEKFNVEAKSLASNKKYYYRTYLLVWGIYIYGDTKSFTTKPIDDGLVVTGDATNIGLLKATLGGSTNLKQFEAEGISTSVGVEISENEDFIRARKISVTGNVENFNAEVTSLNPETKYYYRTYLKFNNNSQEHNYFGEIKSFTTKPINKDAVVTGDVTNIGLSKATLSGSSNLKQFEAEGISTSVGVEISENNNFSNARKFSFTENVENFNAEVTSLNPETKYYYRSYLKFNNNSRENYFYGEIKSFTTKPINEDAVVTGDATNIGLLKATLGGSTNLKQFEAEGISTSVGVEISENNNFSNARKISVTGNVESFNAEVTSLNPETKYYYRTYLKFNNNSQEKVYYGEKKSFTTNGLDNSNHYVDLGLSSGTLWATINVGATKPEDYGSYFAWGETKTKSEYSSGTYFDSSYSKYNISKKEVLLPEDDAAYVNWDSGWRMPSFEQFKELRDQCTWTWMTINNVEGYVVEGKNGNGIFLPAAGFRRDTFLISSGLNGFYWSRTLYSLDSSVAWDLKLGEGRVSIGSGNYFRYYGQSVRPVRNQ